MTGLIIPAAGQGKRLGAKKPKQFLKISKIPLLIFTLQKFIKCPEIDFIIIVTSKSFISEVEKLIKNFKIPKVYAIVEGGKTRQQSVFSGLKACPDKTKLVFVHDAVRPFVPAKLITRLRKAISYFDGVIPVVPVRDALAKVLDRKVEKHIPREKLYHIQTPQLAKYTVLKSCLEKAEEKQLDFPDESSLLTYFGHKIGIVKGSLLNFKITYAEDFYLAETLINCKIEAVLESEDKHGDSMDK